MKSAEEIAMEKMRARLTKKFHEACADYGLIADGAEMTTNSLYYGRSVRLVCVQSVPTSIGDIQSSNIPCIKVLHNGKILINQNGEMYDVTGKKVSAL